MKKIVLILFIGISLTINGYGVPVAGIEMPNTFKAGNKTLVLNGTGIRRKFFFDIYAAGLYVEKKSKNSRVIINRNSPVAIRLHMVSSLVNAKNMSEATREGFRRSTNGNIAPLKGKIDRIISVFQQGIKKYDVYDLVYLPNRGVTIYKNKRRAITVPGMDIKKALFGIWLGRRTELKSLRSQLLGL